MHVNVLAVNSHRGVGKGWLHSELMLKGAQCGFPGELEVKWPGKR